MTTRVRRAWPAGYLNDRLFERGMTQVELAAVTGLSVQTIAKAARGGVLTAVTTTTIIKALNERPVILSADEMALFGPVPDRSAA